MLREALIKAKANDIQGLVNPIVSPMSPSHLTQIEMHLSVMIFFIYEKLIYGTSFKGDMGQLRQDLLDLPETSAIRAFGFQLMDIYVLLRN